MLPPNSELSFVLGIVRFCSRTEMLDFWRKLRRRSPKKSAISEANKIKRLGAKNFNKYRELRFNNNPTALIFRSFDQAKEQRLYFRVH